MINTNNPTNNKQKIVVQTNLNPVVTNTNIRTSSSNNTNNNKNSNSNISTNDNNNLNANPYQNKKQNINTNIQNNPLPDRQKFAKKAELMKQKILTNATITYNSYQYRIQQLNTQLDSITQQARNMLKQLNTKIQQISTKYKSDINLITNLNNSDQSKIKSQQHNKLLTSQQVKKYLITEKSMLSNLISSATNPQNHPTSSSSQLHTLLKKCRLQKHMEDIQIMQLQKQINYLQTHVISNAGLIYVPQDTMSNAEQEELNKSIQMMVQELERLVMLEVVCSGDNDSFSYKKGRNKNKDIIHCLDQQAIRLDKVYQMLNVQKCAIQTIQKSIQKHIQYLKNMPSSLHTNHTSLPSSTSTSTLNQPVKNTRANHLPYLTKPSHQQLQLILNNSITQQQQSQTGQIINNQTCDLDQLNYNLKILRNKLKKIQ